ncbi:MAG: hypothetical protein ABIS86_24395 [Streptosporangiaceae bacterium]
MAQSAGLPVPRLGAGPESDPGYLGSLGSGTMLAQLRATFLALAAVPLVVVGLAPYIIRIETGHLALSPKWATLAVLVLAAAAAVLAPRVPGRLRTGLAPNEAAAASSVSFRSAVLLRFTLAEGVILGGLPLSMACDSLTPMLLAFVLGYPLLIALALPTRSTIERMRRRMESGGASSELWAALLAPYR